jgi:transposase
MFGDRLNSKQFLKFLKKLHAKYPLLLIILDNAKWHKAKCILSHCEKTGILFEFLPPYSPELSPIEQWWKKLKHTTANRLFHTEQQLRRHVNSEARKKKNRAKMFPYLCP